MSRIILLFCFFLSSGFIFSEDKSSIVDCLKNSSWISDKETTLAWVKRHRPNLYENQTLHGLLGKMEISFLDGEMVASEMGREISRRKVTILGQVDNQIAISLFDPIQNKIALILLTVKEDRFGYDVYDANLDFRESFKKRD